jgi:hypothetical protein
MGSSRRFWRKRKINLRTLPQKHIGLENPRPKGGIYELTENALSSVLAEPFRYL